MVVILIIFEIEKSRITYSQVYDERFNDDKKQIREVYLRDRIMQEYLFLRSIENDQIKVSQNTLPSNLIIDHFHEKYHIDNEIKYEGIIMVEKEDLFYSQKNIYWKYHLGHCIIIACEDYENIQMASNLISILQLFITKETLSKEELLISVIDSLLPSGQLMFMTIELAKNLLQKKK